VLEAAACGVPVVTSRIPPFTEYLGADDVAWCDPYDIRSIAQAILRALQPELARAFIARGAAVAARHDWRQTATAHLNAYEAMREKQDA